MSTRSVFGVAALGLLATAGAITAVLTSDHVTGEAGTIALAAPTGLAFIGSGLVARRRRPQNDTGVLLILVGFAWFLAALPSADNSLVFTIGLALTGLFIGFLAHLLLAFPSGRLGNRFDRVITRVMYVLVSAAPLAILMLDEGDISQTACERGSCPDNLLAVVAAQPVANALAAVYALGVGGLSVVVAVRLFLRWRRATLALRRALNPVVLTAGILIAAFAVQTGSAVLVSSEAAEAVNWVVLGAMLAVPLAFLYGLLRARLTASARRIAAELAEQRRPEEVQEVLRRAVRDPTLELGYVSGSDGGYVGVDGRPLALPGPESGRAVTRVGEEVIVHDASLRDQPELDELVDAALIALERGLSLRSLEASERRGDALIEAIPDNVYRIRADGTYLDVRIKGPTVVADLDVDRLVGRKLADVLPPDIAARLQDGLARALETGETQTIEYHVEQPAGARDAEVRVVRSGPDDAVMIVRDVTERKHRERQLRSLADEQAALSRVAVAVATEKEPQRLFDVVSEEVGRLFRAQGANLARYDVETREAVVLGRWGEAGAMHVEIGERLTFDGSTPFARVLDTEGPVLVNSLEGIPGERADWMRSIGIKSVVAAPVHVRRRLWGAVVAIRTDPTPFPPQAEHRLEKFAALVAFAVANAEAREGLAMLAAEQAALSRVAIAVATETPSDRLFDVVTEEVGRLFDAAWAEMARFDEDGQAVISAGQWSLDPEYQFKANVGDRIPFSGGPFARVYETGLPARLDFDKEPEDQREEMVVRNALCAVAAPIFVGERLWGAITMGVPGPETFPPDTPQRLTQFTGLVGVAVVNAETREQLAASRARIVQAGDDERRRLERNLHDGAQQRLVTLSLAIRLAQAKLSDPEAARAVLDSAANELAAALEELREFARGIHPAILSDRGLAPALEALTARAPIPVELHGVGGERLPPPVEAAAYYVVAESLTNVVKYAGARTAQVRLARQNGLAVVEVEDDGVGGADAKRGTGLRGLADRVEALDGRLTVTSEEGRGTRVRAEIPLDPA